MGYVCYISLALIGGLLGGTIYSLATGSSHKIHLPFFGKQDTGCLGDIFVGSFSGLILLSIAIAHFNFNIDAAVAVDAHPFFSPSPLGRSGMLVVIHTLSISLIGGFLGLKLIELLAEKALKELQKDVGNLAGQLQEKDKKDAAFRHAAFARELCYEKKFGDAEAEISTSLKAYPTKFGELVFGLILKRQGKLKDAIAALDRAMKLPPDSFLPTDAAIFWNKACYIALLEPTNFADIFGNLDKSLAIKPAYRNDIKGEDDLKHLLDKPEFKTHYNL